MHKVKEEKGEIRGESRSQESGTRTTRQRGCLLAEERPDGIRCGGRGEALSLPGYSEATSDCCSPSVCHSFVNGSVNVKVLPCPRVLSAQIVPPWYSTI